jgi:hypothetical protein
MAEDVVVRDPFTDQMKDSGRQIIEELDRVDFDVVAAFWLYSSEFNEWRLMIASPVVDASGPKAAYTIVQEALKRFSFDPSVLALHNISVLGRDDPLVHLFRNAIRFPGLGGTRLTRYRVSGVFIEDAYIYRSL